MVEAFDTWRFGKNSFDYHLDFDEWWQRDLTAMVLRDRNAPSVLMWSIGNEIGMRHTVEGAILAANLSALVRSLDGGGGGSRRAVTSAYPGPGADNATDAFFAPLDIAGYNYAQWAYDRDHERVPSRIIVATETFPARSVEMFQYAEARPYVLGNFIWTAIDYIGESSIGASVRTTDEQPSAPSSAMASLAQRPPCRLQRWPSSLTRACLSSALAAAGALRAEPSGVRRLLRTCGSRSRSTVLWVLPCCPMPLP